jgi:hypothetical protein
MGIAMREMVTGVTHHATGRRRDFGTLSRASEMTTPSLIRSLAKLCTTFSRRKESPHVGQRSTRCNLSRMHGGD